MSNNDRNRYVGLKSVSLTVVLLVVVVPSSGCGALGALGGGPVGGILNVVTAIIGFIGDLPNPIDTEFMAADQPTASQGIITDRLLGRNIAPVAIFRFEFPASAGTVGPDGRVYYTERVTGRVMAVDLSTLGPAVQIVDLPVNSSGHRGLKGVCFAPDGSRMFVTYTASTTGGDSFTEPEGMENRLSSYPFGGGAVTGAETVLISGAARDDLFPSDVHTIGKCAIGGDGMLYFAHGDLNSRLTAQNIAASGLAGKIHRLALDGSIPADNPFGTDNSTYCLGLRHPTDIGFDSQTGEFYIVENGNVISDELNLGGAGVNFGWPLVQGLNNTDPEAILTTITIGIFRNPLIDFGVNAVNPMGVVVLRNGPYGDDLNGDVLIGENGMQGQVVRWSLDDAPFVLRTPLFQTAVESGPIVDMFIGANGFVYVVTEVHLYRVDPA